MSGLEQKRTSELTQLLEDISTYQRDVVLTMKKQKDQQQKKDVIEKRQAEDMWQSAMESCGVFSMAMSPLHYVALQLRTQARAGQTISQHA